MTDPLAESTALRLLLGYLEEDAPGCIDSVARTIAEFEGDPVATTDVILTLLTMLIREIDHHGHHRGAWECYAQARLAALLDELGAER